MAEGGLTFQFRSKSILSYYKRGDKKKSHSLSISMERQKSIENLLKAETYSGKVTLGSQKRLTRAIENLLQVAKSKPFMVNGKEYHFKLNFITLTFYSIGNQISAKEGHKTCLEPFLRWLRTKGMTAYVWKAELQSKRKDCKQLHYHLTTDVYVDAIEIRNKWNELQRKAGYLDYFFEKYGHWNANSTDVHATYKQKNLIAYLKKAMNAYDDKKKYEHLRSKYLVTAEMAKDVQNKDSVEGKVWDCSQNIKTSYYEIKDYYDVTARIARAVSDGEMVKKEFDRCIVYELLSRNRDAASYLPWVERQFYNDHIEKMRNFQRLKPDIKAFSSS